MHTSFPFPLIAPPQPYYFLSQIHDFGLFCDSFSLATDICVTED